MRVRSCLIDLALETLLVLRGVAGFAVVVPVAALVAPEAAAVAGSTAVAGSAAVAGPAPVAAPTLVSFCRLAALPVQGLSTRLTLAL